MKFQKKSKEEIARIFQTIKKMRGNPQVDKYGAEMTSDTNETPDGRFRYLVGLLLSSQTKDPITATAVFKLDRFLPLTQLTPKLQQEIDECEIDSILQNKTHNLTITNVRASSEAAIKHIIRHVGFYNTKTANLKKIANLIEDVPSDLKDLLKLPGIGPKMALLILKCCYGRVEGIAVDTHVHRIAQRLGLAGNSDQSATAEAVRRDLEEHIPKELWPEANWLLVGFGQSRCFAVNPQCKGCSAASFCLYEK